MTIQDAIVWHVGIWANDEESTTASTAATGETPEGEGETSISISSEETTAAAPPLPPEQRGMDSILPVTLLISPQDALVLKYLQTMGADLDLVLRSTGDESPVITEAVWFRYVIDRYQIPATLPDLPVAPTPLSAPLEFSTPTPPPEE